MTDTMTTRVETITPEWAAKILAAHDPNRNLRPAHVSRLARAIKDGQWMLTHQGVAFDREGRLLDGQHRLAAVVLAGKPVLMNVTTDADPASFAAVDSGLKRSAADVLHLAGFTGGHQLAAAARLHNQIRVNPSARTLTSAYSLDNSAIPDYVAAHPALLPSHSDARRCSHTRIPISNLTAALTLIRETTGDAYALASFVDRIADGAGLAPGDPRLTLREAALRSRGSGGRRGVGAVEQAAYVIKAWNAYRTGRVLPSLRWRANESFPTVSA